MMRQYQKTITVYELHDDFVVEVHREKELTEFYIYHKTYGIKTLMFGLPDCDVATEAQIIEANVEDYMAIYKEEYCDYTDDGEECFM